MSKSLQDQLRQSGLANKKQEVRARKAKNHKEKLARTGHAVEDEVAKAAREAAEAKAERDRELNLALQAEADRKAIQAQIREIIDLNRIGERGDIEYRYTEGTLIKTLMVKEPQRRALVNGQLAIVRLGECVDLLPRAAAAKIAERDATVVVQGGGAADSEAEDASENEYAEFKVPDDLMW